MTLLLPLVILLQSNFSRQIIALYIEIAVCALVHRNTGQVRGTLANTHQNGKTDSLTKKKAQVSNHLLFYTKTHTSQEYLYTQIQTFSKAQFSLRKKY